jgi:hypothetical protein
LKELNLTTSIVFQVSCVLTRTVPYGQINPLRQVLVGVVGIRENLKKNVRISENFSTDETIFGLLKNSIEYPYCGSNRAMADLPLKNHK